MRVQTGSEEDLVVIAVIIERENTLLLRVMNFLIRISLPNMGKK
jgi:hypothetical protein